MLAEGQADIAVREFDRILDRHPQWIPGHVALAQLRSMTRGTHDFTAALDRALSATPRSSALWFEKIRLLIGAEMYVDAFAAVKAARDALGPERALTINEAICASELGDEQLADRLFESLKPFDDMAIPIRYIRHLLRTRRVEQAADLAETLIDRDDSDQVWPYLSVAWRLLDDPRWTWLEGNPALVGIYDLSESIGSLEPLAKGSGRFTSPPTSQSTSQSAEEPRPTGRCLPGSTRKFAPSERLSPRRWKGICPLSIMTRRILFFVIGRRRSASPVRGRSA